MFQSEGTFKVTIDEIMIAESKFATGPNDFDICVRVTHIDDPSQTDWWRGEVSDNYGKGNFATQMQKEITMARLRRLGFDGDDISQLEEQLVGKETVATIKSREYEGKVYYDIKSLGAGGNTPAPLDKDEAKARIAAMFGGGKSGAPSSSASGASGSSKKNPFAK